MNDNADKLLVTQGHVKWFDSVKGFGFVVSPDTNRDILLHVNVLRSYGKNTVANGAEISLSYQETERGVQAVEVLKIALPAAQSIPLSADGDVLPVSELEKLELLPACVKWFDKAKGFGFANIFGYNEDIFIHAEILRSSGFTSLQMGEAVGIKVIEGERGRMAVWLAPWDAAAMNSG